MNNALAKACESLGLDAEVHSDSIDLSVGRGLMKRELSIDIPPNAPPDDTAPPEEQRRWAGGWARGLLAALSEPPNSHGDKLDFIDTTPRIFMTLETPAFVQAAETALEEPVETREFYDLRFVYRIELDNGQRLLPESQVENWGVHPERIFKAAVSIVFHRTGENRHKLQSYEGLEVSEFQLGDGCDAPRAVLMEQLFFSRSRSGLYLAVPSPDHLIFLDADESKLTQFSNVAKKLFKESEFPLSTSVYAYENARLADEPIR